MNLRDRILQTARPWTLPNQKPCSIIALAERDAIAAERSIAKKEVETAALEAGVIPQRYLRNIGSLGIEGQIKLLQARVLLMGAGGLGGTVAQLLARMGVGTLVLADGDTFSEDNLNRQAFALEPTVGLAKVQVAQSELRKINAATAIEVWEGFAAEKEIGILIQKADVAVDALDNMPSRFALEKVCKGEGIPLVHGAVAGFSGQITVIFPGDIGFKAFYGEGRTAPEKGVEVELGNLAGIVSAIASLQVQETVKILTGLGRPLRNKLLFLDSLSGACEIITLS